MSHYGTISDIYIHNKRGVKKRKYSRNGCIECKRRKLKCDETHPICQLCQRFKAVCKYPDNVKVQQVEDLAGNGKHKAQKHEADHNLGNFNPQATTMESIIPVNQEQESEAVKGVLEYANYLANDLSEYELEFQSWPMLDISPARSESASKELFDNSYNLGFDENSYFETLKTWNNNMNNNIAEENYVSNSELITEVINKNNLSGTDLFYFKEITSTRMSFHLHPFASNIETNQAVHIFLQHAVDKKYLLYSLLALGATYSFAPEKKAVHDTNRKKYVSKALELVKAEPMHYTNNEDAKMKIEGLILTVLLLSTFFAEGGVVDSQNVTNSWTIHLDQARELLFRYNKLIELEPSRESTPGITLAKLWFYIYEGIVVLNTEPALRQEPKFPFRESFSFNYEVNPQYHTSLVKLGFLIANLPPIPDFNMFLGCTDEVIIAWDLFESYVNELSEMYRQTGVVGQLSPGKISTLLSAIQRAEATKIMPQVKSDYKINITSLAHPEYNLPDKVTLPHSAYAVDKAGSPATYYSWYDFCQQMLVRYLYLKVFTSPGFLHLPRRHAMITNLVDETCRTMFFVKRKPVRRGDTALAETENYYLPFALFDHKSIMYQLTFRCVCELATTDDQFERLELIFTGLKTLGHGAASIPLERIALNRKRAAEIREKEKNGKGDFFDRSDYEYSLKDHPIY